MKCEGFYDVCDRDDAQVIPCRTAYYYETTKYKLEHAKSRWLLIEVDATPEEIAEWEKKYNPDPNSNPVLCPECALGYNEYWDEMWKEYHSGLL
jgi:hypothetical protein